MDEKIADFCKKWNIIEFLFFGSVLTDKYNNNSDIDVLVSFSDKTSYGFFELYEIKEELEKLLGRKVDLLTKRGVNNSRNYIRRKSIFDNSKLVYAER
jgi:hypothetical protein